MNKYSWKKRRRTKEEELPVDPPRESLAIEPDVPLSSPNKKSAILDNALSIIIGTVAILIFSTWYFKTDLYGLINSSYEQIVNIINETDVLPTKIDNSERMIPQETEKERETNDQVTRHLENVVNQEPTKPLASSKSPKKPETVTSNVLPDGTEMDARYNSTIRQIAGKLEFEPCDRNLQRSLYRRLATEKLTRDLGNLSYHWAENCSFSSDIKANLYYDSAGKYFSIGEMYYAYQSVQKGTELKPENARLRLRQALIESELGLFVEANENFRLGIVLHSDNKTIANRVFMKYAEALSELGEGCQSIDVYRTMMEYKNLSNTESIGTKVKNLQTQYNCGIEKGIRITIPRGGKDTAPIKVSINGVEGTFILDTGATITSLSPEFAEKSTVKYVGRTGSFQTANGKTVVRFANADAVSVEGKNIGPAALAVLNSDLGKHDGLLGMNILSRFDMEKTGDIWILIAR